MLRNTGDRTVSDILRPCHVASPRVLKKGRLQVDKAYLANFKNMERFCVLPCLLTRHWLACAEEYQPGRPYSGPRTEGGVHGAQGPAGGWPRVAAKWSGPRLAF